MTDQLTTPPTGTPQRDPRPRPMVTASIHNVRPDRIVVKTDAEHGYIWIKLDTAAALHVDDPKAMVLALLRVANDLAYEHSMASDG